jgi:hypothetical protein
VSFYGQYDAETGEANEAPATEEAIPSEFEQGQEGVPFESIETGTLERDLALHQPAPLEETSEGEVVDLGLVEGLSGAPSTLDHLTRTAEDGEDAESDTIGRLE